MTLQSALGLYKSIRPTDIDFDIDIVMYFGLSKSITVDCSPCKTKDRVCFCTNPGNFLLEKKFDISNQQSAK